jgi:hypothetical protein
MPNPARFTAEPNDTTNFYPADTNWYSREYGFVASTAIEQGSALEDSSGNLTNADSDSTNIVGILASYDIATDDADYATAGKERLVWIPKTEDAEVYFTVGAGTFTTADVHKQVKLNDATSVAVDTSGSQFEITGYISSTRGRGKFLI